MTAADAGGLVLPPDPPEIRIARPARVSDPDNGGRVLLSLLDMALGSRNARTEVEALQLNFLGDDS